MIISLPPGPAGGLPLFPLDAGAAGGEVSGRGAPRAAQVCPRTQLHGSAGLQECLVWTCSDRVKIITGHLHPKVDSKSKRLFFIDLGHQLLYSVQCKELADRAAVRAAGEPGLHRAVPVQAPGTPLPHCS